jgi:hypothetical protein
MTTIKAPELLLPADTLQRMRADPNLGANAGLIM